MSIIKLLPGFAEFAEQVPGFTEQAAVAAILNPKATDTKDFDDPVDLSVLFSDELD